MDSTDRVADVPALRIRDLAKRFAKPVITGLNLEIGPGQLYALLGPNGAGKTTTLRMVAVLTRPDAGIIEVFGHDVVREPLATKAVTAWLPDEPMLYDKLTPTEYLAFVAGLWRLERETAAAEAERLLRWLDLWNERDTPCEGFSRGMKQKVALAGALIHDPRLLILDEPLTGLDATMARQVKTALRGQVEAGKTVIVTTHILTLPNGWRIASASSRAGGCSSKAASTSCARRRERRARRSKTFSSA